MGSVHVSIFHYPMDYRMKNRFHTVRDLIFSNSPIQSQSRFFDHFPFTSIIPSLLRLLPLRLPFPSHSIGPSDRMVVPTLVPMHIAVMTVELTNDDEIATVSAAIMPSRSDVRFAFGAAAGLEVAFWAGRGVELHFYWILVEKGDAEG